MSVLVEIILTIWRWIIAALGGILDAMAWAGRAWAGWRVAFGTSDVLERPDFSTLATRAAGHYAVGAAAVALVLSVATLIWGPRVALIWITLGLLAAFYAAWEMWQRRVDPLRHQRRVARVWDMLVDWSSVMLGGATISVAAVSGAGGYLAVAAATSMSLIIWPAAVMSRGR